jgi:hypothetical protein
VNFSGCYRIEGMLELTNRTGLVLTGGTFRSLSPPDDQRAIWRLVNSTGFVFRDMTIDGSYASGGTLDESLQHAHAIDLRGSGAEIDHLIITDVAGDGVYFGLGYDNTTASTGSVHDSSITRTGRQAVSFVAAHDVLVQHNKVGTVGLDAFDIEPNVNLGPGVQRVRVDSNTIGSYGLYAWSVVMDRPTSDNSFTNNHVTASQGLRVGVVNPSGQPYRPQRVTVTGNVADSPASPPAVEVSNTDGLTVTGNAVPLTGGTFALVSNSTAVNVSDNGFREAR